MPSTSGSYNPEPNRPRCSVVVSTYNEGHRVLEAVDSLLNQTEQRIEIIVVDDGSDDDSRALLAAYEAHPKVQVLTLSENQGVPRARNAGVALASGEIIAFIDADASAPEHWLENLLKPFACKEVGCVGGPDVAPADDGLFALCVDYTLHSVIATGGLRRGGKLARYAPAGCNMAVRADTLIQVGLFDERLSRRGEEKELIQRIRRRGWRVAYMPEAMIWHHRRQSIRSFWKQLYLSGRARVDILLIAPDALEAAHLFPAMVTLILIFAGLAVVLWSDQPIVWVPLVLYSFLVLGNGLLGALQNRSLRATWYIALTSCIVHLGYGTGFWVRLAEFAVGRTGRSPQRPHNS